MQSSDRDKISAITFFKLLLIKDRSKNTTGQIHDKYDNYKVFKYVSGMTHVAERVKLPFFVIYFLCLHLSQQYLFMYAVGYIKFGSCKLGYESISYYGNESFFFSDPACNMKVQISWSFLVKYAIEFLMLTYEICSCINLEFIQ